MTAPTRDSTSSGDERRKTARKVPVGGVEPKPRADVEVGVTATLPWQISYKSLWEALRTDEITVRDLTSMRNTDGQARALYRLITLPIRAALKTATFVPSVDAEGGDEEAQFIQLMLTSPPTAGGMSVPFGRFMAQLLLAVFDGFSAFEMVYWQPKEGPLKGKWTLKKMAQRPSEQLTFLLDDNNEFKALRQQTMYHEKHIDVTIDGKNVVYYAANAEERPFYGQSYFIAAYHHWEAKFKLYVISHIAAQRAAVGTRVGTLPSSPSRDEKLEFQRSLSDLGVAQWMTVPEGYTVESLKESGGFDYLSYISHHNSQMSKSVLAAFFDDAQGTGGDASLIDFGRQSDALFLLMLQTIMGEVEEVINTQVIPKFIDWNFNTGLYPTFRFGTMTDEQKGALLDLYKTLAAAGETMATAPEMFREIEKQIAEEFGLEVDWEAVEAREAEEAEQAELALQEEQLNSAGAENPQMGPVVGGAAGTIPAGGAAIDPQNVPEGFALTNREEFNLTLSGMAADLLDDALATLTRGKPRSGGPKFVRSVEGAKTYGVPVGTAITRDMEKGLAKHGKEGEKYGHNHTKNPNKTVRHAPGESVGGGKGAPATDPSTKHGGGTGAQAKDKGGINQEGGAQVRPQQILTNPKEPGAQLIDYGDGTVAIRDAQGRLTPRQRFNLARFAALGWEVDEGLSPANPEVKAVADEKIKPKK